jgi:hypothetical protein
MKKAITIIAISVTFWFVTPIIFSGVMTGFDWLGTDEGVRVMGTLFTLGLVMYAAKLDMARRDNASH